MEPTDRGNPIMTLIRELSEELKCFCALCSSNPHTESLYLHRSIRTDITFVFSDRERSVDYLYVVDVPQEAQRFVIPRLPMDKVQWANDKRVNELCPYWGHRLDMLAITVKNIDIHVALRKYGVYAYHWHATDPTFRNGYMQMIGTRQLTLRQQRRLLYRFYKGLVSE